jgi:hypothetical protein
MSILPVNVCRQSAQVKPMQTISQLIKNRKWKVKTINNDKQYLILSIENIPFPIYVPFNLVPSSVLFDLMQENHSSDPSNSR